MDLPKPLARLLNANTLTETIIKKGYPHLKMWMGVFEAAREEVKKTLEKLGGTLELTETTDLVLEESERTIFSTKTILEGLGLEKGQEELDRLQRLGCMKKIKVWSMVERGKKNV